MWWGAAGLHSKVFSLLNNRQLGSDAAHDGWGVDILARSRSYPFNALLIILMFITFASISLTQRPGSDHRRAQVVRGGQPKARALLPHTTNLLDLEAEMFNWRQSSFQLCNSRCNHGIERVWLSPVLIIRLEFISSPTSPPCFCYVKEGNKTI